MKMPEDFQYLPDMYGDGYFPNALVDKVKAEIEAVAAYLEAGPHPVDAVQEKLDAMTDAINDLQEAFWEADSEIETVARDDIAVTVHKMLLAFGVTEIDIETAVRNRDW